MTPGGDLIVGLFQQETAAHPNFTHPRVNDRGSHDELAG